MFEILSTIPALLPDKWTPIEVMKKDPRNAFRILHCSSEVIQIFVPATAPLVAFAKFSGELSDLCSVCSFIQHIRGYPKKKHEEDPTAKRYLSFSDLVVDVNDMIQIFSVKKICELSLIFLQHCAVIAGLVTLWQGSVGLCQSFSKAQSSWEFFSDQTQGVILAISLIGLGFFSALESYAELRALADTTSRVAYDVGLVAFPIVPHYALLMLTFSSLLALSSAYFDYRAVCKDQAPTNLNADGSYKVIHH